MGSPGAHFGSKLRSTKGLIVVEWFWFGCFDNESEFHERCYHSSNVFSISTDYVSNYSLFHSTRSFTLMFNLLYLRFVHTLKSVVSQVNVWQVSTSSDIFTFWSEIDTKFANQNNLQSCSIAGGLEIGDKGWSLQQETGYVTGLINCVHFIMGISDENISLWLVNPRER